VLHQYDNDRYLSFLMERMAVNWWHRTKGLPAAQNETVLRAELLALVAHNSTHSKIVVPVGQELASSTFAACSLLAQGLDMTAYMASPPWEASLGSHL
jgi:hypothetical protein